MKHVDYGPDMDRFVPATDPYLDIDRGRLRVCVNYCVNYCNTLPIERSVLQGFGEIRP